MRNFSNGARSGLRSAITAETVLPVAIKSTWPDKKAAIVALLLSKRLMLALAGARFDNDWSSTAPRVTATVVPARSAGLSTLMSLVPKTFYKNDTDATEK